MAVVEMQHICIFALKKDRKPVLETLQRRGVVEIEDVLEEDSVFQKADMTASRTQFEKNIESSNQALEVLDRIAPEEKPFLSFLCGRKEVPLEDYDGFSKKRDEVLQTIYRINALSKDLAENQAQRQKLQTQIEALSPWLDLDIPMRFKGTKSTAAFIGTLGGGLTGPKLEEQFAQLLPETAVHISVISSTPEQTCVFILCSHTDAASVEEALRSLGFARPAAPSKTSPAARVKILRARLEELDQKDAEATKEIAKFATRRADVQFMVDYLSMRLEKYEVIEHLMQSRRTFVLTGYAPKPQLPALQKELEQSYDLALEADTPDSEQEVPVLLKNNGFAAPVESVVESYSLPGRHEIDPSSIMAFFYYVMFGMMLGDAGYGLLMVGVCGTLLLKFRNMEESWKKSLKMFFFCGVSTAAWGFLFGSFFGDVVGVVASTFFHSDVKLGPLWFEPLNDPMRLLLFSLGVGVLHLFVGLGIQFYQLVKQKKIKDAIYDVVFWYLLVGGLIVLLMTTDMFYDLSKFKFSFPPAVNNVVTALVLIGAVGIIGTAGRESRNPFKRLLKGLYGLYNVTGYLSDILSYSRLLALGLATGVIATVVNKMGTMGGDSIVGVILFVVVFLIGHTVNIGINMLGAYVHTNRLQFVEFFGKFYEGGGRKFHPFAIHTKYYKFKEDKNHG